MLSGALTHFALVHFWSRKRNIGLSANVTVRGRVQDLTPSGTELITSDGWSESDSAPMGVVPSPSPPSPLYS